MTKDHQIKGKNWTIRRYKCKPCCMHNLIKLSINVKLKSNHQKNWNQSNYLRRWKISSLAWISKLVCASKIKIEACNHRDSNNSSISNMFVFSWLKKLSEREWEPFSQSFSCGCWRLRCIICRVFLSFVAFFFLFFSVNFFTKGYFAQRKS